MNFSDKNGGKSSLEKKVLILRGQKLLSSKSVSSWEKRMEETFPFTKHCDTTPAMQNSFKIDPRKEGKMRNAIGRYRDSIGMPPNHFKIEFDGVTDEFIITVTVTKFENILKSAINAARNNYTKKEQTKSGRKILIASGAGENINDRKKTPWDFTQKRSFDNGEQEAAIFIFTAPNQDTQTLHKDTEAVRTFLRSFKKVTGSQIVVDNNETLNADIGKRQIRVIVEKQAFNNYIRGALMRMHQEYEQASSRGAGS